MPEELKRWLTRLSRVRACSTLMVPKDDRTLAIRIALSNGGGATPRRLPGGGALHGDSGRARSRVSFESVIGVKYTHLLSNSPKSPQYPFGHPVIPRLHQLE